VAGEEKGRGLQSLISEERVRRNGLGRASAKAGRSCCSAGQSNKSADGNGYGIQLDGSSQLFVQIYRLRFATVAVRQLLSYAVQYLVKLRQMGRRLPAGEQCVAERKQMLIRGLVNLPGTRRHH